MRWFEKIKAAHLTVTDQVSHYERMKSDRYFVWQEEYPEDLNAESSHVERTMYGTSDLFTKRELDPWAEALESAFTEFGIAWQRISTQHEENTGFIHIEWRWGVIDGKSSG